MTATSHAHGPKPGWKLGVAFFLSFGILAVLVVGGVLSHSLALLADAGHVVTDIAALGLSWLAVRQAGRPADAAKTYGYQRTGILAALANGVSLILIAAYICWEAYGRMDHPPEVASGIMMGAAAVGMVLNLGIGAWLHGDSGANLNVRSAFLHVMGDAAASAGVIVGGVVIALTGWHIIDPLLSAAIALFIAYSAWALARESVDILMEAAPTNLDLTAIQADLACVDGVAAVHDFHVWSITSGQVCLSCHVTLQPERLSDPMAVIEGCTRLLQDKYGITHATIQPEARPCAPTKLPFICRQDPDHLDEP